MSNLLVKHSRPFSPAKIARIMSNVTPEEFAELQKKFSEIKHSINNALAVMMALSENVAAASRIIRKNWPARC